MGHIAGVNIYLREFTVRTSAEITSLLRSKYQDVIETRKGRVWQVNVSEHRIQIDLSVIAKQKWFCDLEDGLLELGYLPDEFPECLNIVAAMGRQADLKACDEIGRLIHSAFDSVTNGAQLYH